jgi:hypothetical protein
VEFLVKMIFQNFFRGKLHFFPTFLGENFRRIFPKIFPGKKCTKNQPLVEKMIAFKVGVTREGEDEPGGDAGVEAQLVAAQRDARLQGQV